MRNATTVYLPRLNTMIDTAWKEMHTINSETGEQRTYCLPVTRDRDATTWEERDTIDSETLEQRTYYWPVSRQGTSVPAR